MLSACQPAHESDANASVMLQLDCGQQKKVSGWTCTYQAHSSVGWQL